MTDPPMYNVANAVFYRSLAIVRSLPLPGCGIGHFVYITLEIDLGPELQCPLKVKEDLN